MKMLSSATLTCLRAVLERRGLIVEIGSFPAETDYHFHLQICTKDVEVNELIWSGVM